MQAKYLAFSRDGNLLAVGNTSHIHVYKMTNGNWTQVYLLMYRSSKVRYLLLLLQRLTVTRIRIMHCASVPLGA